MKIRNILLAALSLALLSGNAYAVSCTTSICKTDGAMTFKSGSTLTTESGSTTTLGGAVDTSGMTATTTLTGNPLMQATVGVLTAAQVNAGTTIIASASGKTIYPLGFSLMASGSATTATGVYLRCGGSNNVIASVPVAMLTDGIPVGPFKSSSTGTGSPILASAFTRGCASGDSVYMSNTGSAVAGATHFYYTVIYIPQ